MSTQMSLAARSCGLALRPRALLLRPTLPAVCSSTKQQQHHRDDPRQQPQRQQQRQWRRRRRPPAAAGRGPSGWEPPSPASEERWEGEADTTETEEDEDADLDLFPEEAQGDPEFVIENVLALVLIALATLAVANILLKLLIVAYSLVAAAVRYTAIGIFLAVLLVGVQPGRWWF